jgi:hypothetical protein
MLEFSFRAESGSCTAVIAPTYVSEIYPHTEALVLSLSFLLCGRNLPAKICFVKDKSLNWQLSAQPENQKDLQYTTFRLNSPGNEYFSFSSKTLVNFLRIFISKYNFRNV